MGRRHRRVRGQRADAPHPEPPRAEGVRRRRPQLRAEPHAGEPRCELQVPWPEASAVADPSGRQKFGFYDDDVAVFEWLRRGAPERRLCIEAQVMDLSDDIAYSVHDFEDAIFNGFIDVAASARARPRRSRRRDERVDRRVDPARRAHRRVRPARLARRVDRLVGRSRRDQAKLKNLTSQLIGRFAHAATEATRSAFPLASLIRFDADVVVPRGIQAEIAVLKGIVAAFVMAKNARQPIYAQQRHILTGLADVLAAAGDDLLDPPASPRTGGRRPTIGRASASSSTRCRASPTSRRSRGTSGSCSGETPPAR